MTERRFEPKTEPKTTQEEATITSVYLKRADSHNAAAHLAWNDSCFNHAMDMPTRSEEFQALKRAGRRGDRNTLCEVVMKTEVRYASPTDSAQEVAESMRTHNVGFMPVCDSNGKILGTITDRDLALRLVAQNLPALTRVDSLMSPDPICCGAQDNVARAQELMAEHRKSRILCVDEAGRLEGIISLSDIAQMEGADAARTLQQISAREAQS